MNTVLMNRKERRRNGIKDKAPVININAYKLQEELEKKLEQAKLEASRKAIKVAIQSLIGLTALTLNGDFGFGEQRLNKLIKRLFEQYDCMESGHITIEDIKMWLKEKNIDCTQLFD